MNAAVFGSPDGGLVVGRGPFESHPAPPKRGVRATPLGGHILSLHGNTALCF